jgi:HEAT repeat protein
LPGADVDKALQDALGQQDPKVRVEAIRALAGRHAVAATPSLLKAAGDPDAGVRNESVKALGVVGPSGALPALAAVLVKTEDGPFRVETANAMVRIASRDPAPENCSEAVLKAMAGCGGPAKISLLGVLGRIGGPKSLEGVRDALKDNDEQVRGAAFTALTEWPDAAAAADLLAIAKTAAGETRHVQALRGYLRVCGIQAERPAAETAALLAAGLAVARRPDEKKMALGELGKVRDIAALEAAVSCLSDSALTEEAACAAAHVARDLWQGHPEAVKTAMRKVLEVSKNAQFRREAQEALDRAEQKPKAAKRK